MTSDKKTIENDLLGPVSQTGLVVKALLRSERRLRDPLAEVVSLARTARVEIVDCYTQRIDRPHPATYLGKGKVEEAARRAAELDVDVLITDNDLSPAQERNLEKITNRTIIDRSQLIMDIFARRARTHQAKLQVELAQLRYSAPRLKRLWTHLSRYEGGIGMRGPGETQLETDKRLISKRIQKLVRELKAIERRKETALLHRRNEFVVALVGYTNAGKSTLLNTLTGSDELVEDTLFATLDTRVRRWALAANRHVLLTDTVGFIHDLPHHLVASFHATLAETREANLLLHVVDASSADAPRQMQTVRKVLHEIECDGKLTWLVLNKWDAVSTENLIEARQLGFQVAGARDGGAPGNGSRGDDGDTPGCYPLSARDREGIDALRDGILHHVKRRDSRLVLSVPHDRGDVVSFLRENADVEETHYRDDAVELHIAISPAREARLRHLFPEGFEK
ncbi:MAG: GTPase HflX [Planctomycetota bacterium]|nr:GTPase HflX [Planctomycetota bacterium]